MTKKYTPINNYNNTELSKQKKIYIVTLSKLFINMNKINKIIESILSKLQLKIHNSN